MLLREKILLECLGITSSVRTGKANHDDHDPSLMYYWNYETGEVTWAPPTQQVDTCLAYFRDRIGVPRDMSAAAAMHLRVCLNWAIQLAK
jgi:hypothetical protein